MTMEFKAANAALLSGLKVGQAVDFEFVERQPGEFVVTWIRPALTAAGDSTAPPVPAASVPDHGPHTGH
jgi:Cu(I)/Ag(I) efflux system membrane fusion protein